MNKHPMTVAGAEALKLELNKLKFEERPRIVDAIATARAHGDLKEKNAEYHAAREQHGFNEGRIQDLKPSYRMRKLLISANYLITAKWFLVLRKYATWPQMLN